MYNSPWIFCDFLSSNLSFSPVNMHITFYNWGSAFGAVATFDITGSWGLQVTLAIEVGVNAKVQSVLKASHPLHLVAVKACMGHFGAASAVSALIKSLRK